MIGTAADMSPLTVGSQPTDDGFDEYITDALARVETETEHIEEKLTAYERFERTVRELRPVDIGTTTATPHATDGGMSAVSTVTEHSTEDPCRRIRDRFDATVRPYSVDDIDEPEPTIMTIREELGEEIAMALSPNGHGQFTPQVRTAILSAVDDRRSELRAMATALDREGESLRKAAADLGDIVDDIRDLGGRYLYQYSFEELHELHDQLRTYRDRCNRLAHERQETLQTTTSHGAKSGIRHRTLIRYLYGELSTTHPVLVTVLRIEEGCMEGQRALRDQLTRRV